MIILLIYFIFHRCGIYFSQNKKPHKNIIYICQNQNMSAFLNENILVCKSKPTFLFAFACHESEPKIHI